MNYVESEAYTEAFSKLYFNEKVNKVVYGRQPKENEIAISVSLADKLLEEFSACCNTYDDVLHLTIDNGNAKLVGIVEGNHDMVYVSEATYLEDITAHIYIPDDSMRYYEYEKKYDSYEIVAGRDLSNADLNTPNILISDKFPGWEQLLDTDIPGVGFAVGVFRMKGIEYSQSEIIVNDTPLESLEGSYKYSYAVEDYLLVEGVQPQKDTECLVSIYSDKKVGEYFDGYKIVGRYNASTQLVKAKTLLSTSALSVDDYSIKVFIVEDEEGLVDSLVGTDYQLKTMYDSEYDRNAQINKEKRVVYGILGTICLVATSIMVFFLMRSKMVNDIYNIGVYRSLGANKAKIYLKYFSDTLVMVTFTSLLSYLLVTVGYLTAIPSINDYFALELFSRGLTIPCLGVAVLYFVNLVFGLLPIFTLLRRTPAEIIAKYDI